MMKARRIRELSEKGHSVWRIAAWYRVSSQTINLVVKDKIWKDTGDEGEELKLGIDSARLIRWRWASGVYTEEELAKTFRVSINTIRLIILEKVLREAQRRP